jgi:hypothetical protein
MPKPPPFKYDDEAHLCREFTGAARDNGFKVWSEAGYDLLLQATQNNPMGFDARLGDFIGIEAKLVSNLKVLSQLITRRTASVSQGPAFFAVLVPRASVEFKEVAASLRLIVITSKRLGVGGQEGWAFRGGRGQRHLFPEACWHPDIEVDIPAGQKSPKQMTKWKMNAVELAVVARDQGYVTSQLFHKMGLSMTVWKANRWIVETGEKIGRLKVYRLGDKAPDVVNPEIAEALRQKMGIKIGAGA